MQEPATPEFIGSPRSHGRSATRGDRHSFRCRMGRRIGLRWGTRFFVRATYKCNRARPGARGDVGFVTAMRRYLKTAHRATHHAHLLPPANGRVDAPSASAVVAVTASWRTTR